MLEVSPQIKNGNKTVILVSPPSRMVNHCGMELKYQSRKGYLR